MICLLPIERSGQPCLASRLADPVSPYLYVYCKCPSAVPFIIRLRRIIHEGRPPHRKIRPAVPCERARRSRQSVSFCTADWCYRFPKIMKEMISPYRQTPSARPTKISDLPSTLESSLIAPSAALAALATAIPPPIQERPVTSAAAR